MVRPYTSTETENRTAFVVQLNALLGSLSAVISINAATKAKLESVQSAVDEWRAAIGPVEISKPYALPTPAPTPAPAGAAVAAVPAAETEASGETPEAAVSASAEASQATPTAMTAAAAGATQADEATAIGSKTVMDLVSLIALLYTSGLPESAKLRATAKGVARLLIVRCTTIVYTALQHVARLTYHPSKSPAETLEVFVVLARDIRRATSAMVRCLELICSFAEFTDVASVRFAQQVSMDALRNVRRAMMHFQARVDREETLLLARELGVSAGGPLAATSHTGSGTDLADSASESGPARQAAASAAVVSAAAPPLPSPAALREHSVQRAAWLRAAWGASLVHSVVQVGHVMGPAVRFLVSVAGVKEVSGPPGMAALKQDAQADLFALGGPSTPSPKEAALAGRAPASGPSSPSPSKADLDATAPREDPAETGPGPSSSALAETTKETAAADAADAADHSHTAATIVASAAALVLPLVGVNFSAECLAAMSENSGDESDGKLVATRVVTDTLRLLGETRPELLHIIAEGQPWKQRLFTGILNCLVSLHPAVLEAGLSDLHLIVTCCPGALGAEVGYLYNNCLLKLLESENSPTYTKKEIIIHIVVTLLAGCPTVSTGTVEGHAGASTPATAATNVPLLLHLYRLYDLNEGAHQLNVVQQFVAALSRVVRSAALTEFAPINAEADLQGSGTALSAAAAKATLELQAARHATLPSLALRGLVLLVEVLATQTPPEDDAWATDLSAQLPTLQCRERKLEGQRRIDVFVAAPKKGIQKIFNVSADEFSPPGHEDFAAEWDHTKCPPPASEAIAGKIHAVTDFLMNVTSTCPDEVAEFLTTPAVFSLQVCVDYMSRLPLAGSGLVDAIQVLLAHVELPKEGQRIERLLEYFSAAYFAANNVPGIDRTVFPFLRDDSCFVVLVATVMLNTDLHNPLSGSRMNQKSFRSQLKACDKVMTDAYADDIFFSISRRPLNSAKSLSAASAAAVQAGGPGSTAQESYYRFDALFISVEERRKLAFGMEQQRLVSETVSSWQCAIPALGSVPTSWQWWCGVARDLFACTWPSVCAVFGPAMYQQNAAVAVPDALLLECIRGLKSLMCVAAAFALPTECEVTLLALLGLCDHASVRAVCRVAILQVAATGYAVHLTTRCWSHVFQLLATMRTELQPAALPPQVEGVLALIERITSTSCAGDSADADAKADARAETATDVPEAISTTAVHRVLEGVLDVLKTCKKGDARTLAAGLYLLRRVLQFTRITHTSRSSDVVTFVDARDFAHMVVPRLVALVTRQSGSDEALLSIFGTIVDLLAAMWKACTPETVMLGAEPSASAAATSSRCTMNDMIESFNVLRACYERHIKSDLVKGHVLQSIQELMSRTLRQLPGSSSSSSSSSGSGRHEGTPQSVQLMLELWRRVLSPVALAVASREAANAETASLAVLVLRKVVVVTCGSQRTLQIPAPCQMVALALLTDVAFVGALCGNVETAQACLAQLTTLCGGCLTREAGAAPTPAPSSPGLSPPRSPLVHHHGPDDDASAHRASVPAQAAVGVMMRMLLSDAEVPLDDRSPGLAGVSADARLASYGMERLCLLTRAASEQTRHESVTNLRTLCLQLRPAHIRPLTVRICHLVMEGVQDAVPPPTAPPTTATTATATGTARSAVLSPSARQSFDILLADVPASVRPCPSETFNATLPALLHLLTNDLLSMAEATQLGEASRVVIESCLLPMCAAPYGTVAVSTRRAAIKALTQCATLCVSRYQASIAAVPTVSALPETVSRDVALYFPVQAFLRATAQTLLQLRVPVERVVPADAAVPGEAHWATAMVQLADSAATFQAAVEEAEAEAAETVVVAELADQTVPVVVASEAADQSAASVNGYSSTDVARAAAAGLGAFRFTGGIKGDGPVPDEALVEYSAHVAQLLSGLPHVLSVILPAVVEQWGSMAAAGSADSGAHPHVSPEALLALLLDAAQLVFAVQWRACHVTEMSAFYQATVHKGGEAQATPYNAALLPHTAVRGVLNSYLELALFTESQSSDALLEVLLGVLEGLGAAQQIAANAGSVSQHRLNAQAQQHIRTCSAGMYQELSIVLASWVKTLTAEAATPDGNRYGSTNSNNSSHSPIPATRVQAFEGAALDPRLFLALARLLTPTAGPLIVTVRDFFAWYISKNGLRPPPTAASTRHSLGAAQLPASLQHNKERAAPPQAAPLHSDNGFGRASFVLESDEEL